MAHGEGMVYGLESVCCHGGEREQREREVLWWRSLKRKKKKIGNKGVEKEIGFGFEMQRNFL